MLEELLQEGGHQPAKWPVDLTKLVVGSHLRRERYLDSLFHICSEKHQRGRTVGLILGSKLAGLNSGYTPGGEVAHPPRTKLPMRYVRSLLAYCAGLACFACPSYGQSQPTEPEKPVETTVCQLITHCKRFDGKRVPFRASIISDGFEYTVAGGPHLRRESISRFAFRHRLRNKIKGAPLLGFFEKGPATDVASDGFPAPTSTARRRRRKGGYGRCRQPGFVRASLLAEPDPVSFDDGK